MLITGTAASAAGTQLCISIFLCAIRAANTPHSGGHLAVAARLLLLQTQIILLLLLLAGLLLAVPIHVVVASSKSAAQTQN
jgi:hypothetical protein